MPSCHVAVRCLDVDAGVDLVTFEQNMPSSANLALKEVAAGSAAGAAKDGAAEGGSNDTDLEALKTALGKIVRSKGFMWLAFSDKAAMYWSHAGEMAEVLEDLFNSANRTLWNLQAPSVLVYHDDVEREAAFVQTVPHHCSYPRQVIPKLQGHDRYTFLSVRVVLKLFEHRSNTRFL